MKKYILIILTFSLFIHITEAKPKIGICLGGGAALGYAHIGVLQALDENGIHPDIIAGSSMGAIVGALYAQGIEPLKMLDIISEKEIYNPKKLLSFTFSNEGLGQHYALKEILEEQIPHNNFDSLKTPLNVCVSNLTNASWRIINHGDSLIKYVIASSSIPYIFEPIKLKDSLYVDGGLYNNLPAQALVGKCDYIIGVDVLPYKEVFSTKKRSDILMYSIRSIEHHNSKDGRKLCNFLIESPAINEYDEFSFKYYKEIYRIGYQTTIEYLKAHPGLKNLAKSNIKK